MTKEEIKDLLKFIIRKCDLVINNENYTADEYAQDKIEDIAEMCHRVLDGQFGEIIEPSLLSLPSNLDEAAKKWKEENFRREYYQIPKDAMSCSFKAGAEWMAGQGVTFETEVYESYTGKPFIEEITESFIPGDKVVVQIRKK